MTVTAKVEAGAVAIAGLALLALLAVGVRSLGYDFDEVTRAHSIWLASRGLRPYVDFFEVHPPYFALVAPLARLVPDPCHLIMTLRIAATVANLVFLVGLARLAGSLIDAPRWAWLGLIAIASRPEVAIYLAEFRIDAVGCALSLWGINRWRQRPDGELRCFELGLTTSLASGLFCPKLVLLTPMIVAVAALGSIRAPRRLGRIVGGYAAGGAVAVVLFALFVAAQGIDFGRLTQLLVRYHAISGANNGFGRGLLRSILHLWPLTAAVAVGLAAWVGSCGHRRAWPGVGERAIAGAVVLWLAAQAALVAYPYKQYFAPWFLFGAVFLGALGRLAFGREGWGRATAMIVVAAAVGGFALWNAGDWLPLRQPDQFCRLIRRMGRIAGPDDRVVAPPPFHPIDRLDSLFLWFNTTDPLGFDTSRIMPHLPSYRDAATPARYEAELAAHPPAIVVLPADSNDGGLPHGQREVLNKFILRRRYRMARMGPVVLFIRPDRAGGGP